MSDATFEPAHPQRIHLGPGRHAIFGYGSLLSMPSVERTLGHPYGGPFVVCGLEGWRRCWDVAMPNRTFFTRIGDESVFPREILYLNIRRAPEETMTGVVFVVSDDELAAYDRRESVYDRVAVADALRGVTVEDGEAWTYVGKPEYIRRGVTSWRDAAVRASYLDIVNSGLTALGPDTRTRYEQSTDPVPQHLIFADDITPA